MAANLTVDMWPDTFQLTPSERCPTSMHLPNGNRLVELIFADPGTYPFVTHKFNDAEKGAVKLFHVSQGR